MYKLEKVTQDEQENWNHIVSRCPYGEALHTTEWRNGLAKSFRQLEPLYFIIRDDNDNVAGAFPCFIFNPFPFVKMMASMPWTLPGGPLIFPEANVPEVMASVIEKVNEISREHHIFEATLTLPPSCSPDVSRSLESDGYVKESTRFTHILETEKGYDEVWEAYNKRVRGAVRKAQKTGVIVRETEDEAEMIEFYKLYMAMMEHFGSTPKPYELLRYLQTSSIARMVIAEMEGRIVAGLLFIHFNSSVRLWCEASDPEYLSFRTNNAIIDYIIRWACENGYPRVDFGASPPENTGLVAFKEEWKARKAWFDIFTKLNSSQKKRLWTASEPALRRVYAAIQKFRLRNV